MKLSKTMISLVGVSVILSGCELSNPFAKEHDPSEQSQNQNSDQNEQGQNEESQGTQSDQENQTNKENTDLPSPEETVTVNADGLKVVTNLPDPLVLVNKDRNLPADYVPEDLTVPDVPFPFEEDLPKKQMRKVAADALEQLFAKAKKDSIPLYAQSGYRSYDRQKAIFASNVQQDGEKEANKYSAHPGQSEHQSGLSIDVTSPEVNYKLIQEFGETKTGKWLKQHAHEYGFIIRYPKGKEDITGYQYEPWHIRYVGVEHATNIHEQNVTLEEYLGVPVEPVNSTK